MYNHTTQPLPRDGANMEGLFDNRNSFKGEVMADSALYLERIFNSVPFGMFVFRTEGEKLVLKNSNKAAGDILGVDPKPLIGKTIEEAFPPLAGTDIPRRYMAAAKEGKSWSSNQVKYQDDAVSGVYLISAFQTIQDEMISSFIDVTELTQKESELKKANIMLEANQHQLIARHEQMLATEQELKAINAELESKLEQVNKFNKLMVGREIDMINLKKEVNSLLLKIGEKEKYTIAGT